MKLSIKLSFFVFLFLIFCYIFTGKIFACASGCTESTVRVCECGLYGDDCGGVPGLLGPGCCQLSCENDTVCDCPDDYLTPDPVYKFGNAQCSTLQSTYPEGDSRRNGVGAMFKGLTKKTMNPDGTYGSDTDPNTPDPNLSDDIPVSYAVNGKKSGAVGISNNLFAFNYKDTFTEQESYNMVAGIDYFTHGRSYSHIVITADGHYQFSLRANRITTPSLYPPFESQEVHPYYCSTTYSTMNTPYPPTPGHAISCKADGGEEDDKVIDYDGNTIECGTTCLEARGCAPGCQLDFRNVVFMWIAVSGSGTDSDQYTPANHGGATTIEEEFANYAADNEWLRLVVFNPHGINPESPDETINVSLPAWFKAGTYAIQMSGIWDTNFKMYNPKFYWSKIDAVNPFPFTEYPPTFATSCSPALQGSTCSGMTLVATPGSTMFVGENRTLTATTTITGTPLDGVNDYVTFVPIGGGINVTQATVNATAGGTTFTTTVNGISPGAFNTVNATLYIDGVATCTSAIVISVREDIGAWWQVKDADVISGGDITSNVPTNFYFNLAGAGGSHGLPIAEGSIYADTVSESPLWMVENFSFKATVPDFYYLFKLAQNADVAFNTISTSIVDQDDFLSTPDTNGYDWHWYSGASELNITGLDFSNGTRKVIIFAGTESSATSRNVKISGTVKVGASPIIPDGGFVMIITDGKITIDPSVTNMEGIFFADGATTIQSVASGNDIDFNLRGTLISKGGLNLLRDLGNVANETSPSEYFEFAPDLTLSIPNILQNRSLRWREVAPVSE